jgi:hypothetical protein
MQSQRRLLESRITYLFDLARNEGNDELRAELAKYLCVLVSGFLEVSCKEILVAFARKRCAPDTLRFVSSRLDWFRSPKTGNIADLLASFDPGGADRWRTSLGDEASDALDSIVSNRHQIAHGYSVGLSLSVLDAYRRRAETAIKLLEKHFPPHKGSA